KRKRRRFGKIEPSDLADVLSVQLGTDCSRMQAIRECSLDDFVDEVPVRDLLKPLQGLIAASRYQKLEAHWKAIADGRQTKAIALTPRERRLMEEGIAKYYMENGGGWWINRHTLPATDGTEVCFKSTRETPAT